MEFHVTASFARAQRQALKDVKGGHGMDTATFPVRGEGGGVGPGFVFVSI